MTLRNATRCLLPLGALLASLLARPAAAAEPATKPVQISGRYPHLAMFNRQGECGTGAVVPWAGRLWVVTYAPHQPKGSDDKLYEIDDDLRRVTRPESVGGTPANRMIHRESKQLSVGPYFIDENRTVRAISPAVMPGRLTATARHLTDPANKVYIIDMEGMIYEVDVKTLASKRLFAKPVPGWHGKGAYTAQGRLVIANNGDLAAGKPTEPYLAGASPKGPDEAGVLAEWDGKEWRIVERRQFTEVTGPGGIEGAPSDDAPLWSVGWDRRSLILKLLDGGKWYTFRLPKADYTYDGTHGWHTEWPRIREVVPGAADGKPAKLLMSMHGGWFDFPKTFSAANTAGLAPIASYLKITADFTHWNGRLVFACDDTAKASFMSPGAPHLDTHNFLIGQSNSNLWFADWQALRQAGRPAGNGGPWLRDAVKANEPSVPYLFAGYDARTLHLAHASAEPVTFTVETSAGDGKWASLQKLEVPAKGYAFHLFPNDAAGQWVRLTPDKDAPAVTAFFNYGPGGGAAEDRAPFAALADVTDAGAWTHAVGRPEGNDTILMGVEARTVDAAGKVGEPQYFHVGADMKYTALPAASAPAKFLRDKAASTRPVFQLDDASVVVAEGKKRFRLPRSNAAYDQPFATGWPRGVREVVTERALLNAHGTFYVLPRENSGGVAHIKPVCTHEKRITDFYSWRGLLVLAGTRADAKPDGHYFPATADAGAPGLWFGDIDDLWKLGKPRGRGGPWLRTAVEANQPSDPYLMLGYDRKTATLSHDAPSPVQITLEVDPAGTGQWLPFRTIEVPAGQPMTFAFPAGYSAHWVRAKAGAACRASVQFVYE